METIVSLYVFLLKIHSSKDMMVCFIAGQYNQIHQTVCLSCKHSTHKQLGLIPLTLALHP